MNCIYGKKVGMTRVYTQEGSSVPVTVIHFPDNVIHQIKTTETDGYAAIQVGIGEQKTQRVNKALTGHFSKAKKGLPRASREIKLKGGSVANYKLGDVVSIDGLFKSGDKVDVRGVTIGKGFAGVMKRHNMAGFKATHGTHEYFRHGGSIGCRKFPGRVFKNKRMPGHMGVDNVLQENLEIVEVRADDKLMFIKGSVPGAKNGIVYIRSSLKHSNNN